MGKKEKNMNGHEVEKVIKKLAPYNLAYEGETLGFIYGDPEKTVKRIGVTWRPTVDILQQCLDKKIDLLINHEPLLQSEKASVIPISRLSFPPNQLRKNLLEKSNLSVLVAHSNWDDAKQGNNDTLAEILEIEVQTRIPFGRIGRVKPRQLREFIGFIKMKLGCENLIVVGDPETTIQVVAVVSGSGNSLVEMMEISKQEGADVLVSGDIQDSRARFGNELNIALVDAGGYYTETPGMRILAKLLQQEIGQAAVVEYLDPGPPWKIY
jgi:dinuclear metal center YbgI/SA1388 family protein